jgi:RHS repeat-associated protein
MPQKALSPLLARLTQSPPQRIGALSEAIPPTTGVNFPANPRDEDFLRTGLFVQPLVPAWQSTAEDNRALASALIQYEAASRGSGDRDDVGALVTFLDAHPDSAWRPALLVGLGGVYRRTGHFSKALNTWQAAWDATKSLPDGDGHALGDVAVGYLSQFEAYLGRKELLAPLLEEIKARPARGPGGEMVSESSRGLAEMFGRPDVSFKCGPSALLRILELQSPSADKSQRKPLDEARSTAEGLSLSAVQRLSVDAKMNYQMAFRSPGAPLIVPAVVHWKMGHYAALLRRHQGDHLRVGDPTFGEDLIIRLSTIDDEASGYFLVPQGALPQGWRQVDPSEGDTVWGRGNTGDNHDTGATGSQELHAFPGCKGGGCSSWNVEAMVVGLSLHDDPVGYTPPVGPPVRFTLEYSQRDQLQPATFYYTNFGNKWTTGWLSYVDDNDGCLGFLGAQVLSPCSFVGSCPGGTLGTVPAAECALLYRRGGGSEPFVFDGTNLNQSYVGQFSQSYLVRELDNTGATTGFLRQMPDGSVEEFKVKGQLQRYFMSSVRDPQGNAVTIQYDANPRMVSITDAIGQVTTICYNDSYLTNSKCAFPLFGNPPSNLQVTQVVDPFTRSAFFRYDPLPIAMGGTGHLLSIIDVLGIQSNFSYQTGTDWITSLQTPYGTTQFSIVDSSTSSNMTPTRSVTVTDPLGRASKVEFFQGSGSCTNGNDTNNIRCSEINIPAPYTAASNRQIGSGFVTANENLQYRNTFIWDPYQYQEAHLTTAQATSAPVYPYSLIHWLHADDANPLTCSRIPESTRKADESRVWYDYPHQPSAIGSGSGQQQTVSSEVVGSSNRPIFVGRYDSVSSTSQIWQYAYNVFGHVVQSVDPVGRTTSYQYDSSNNIDLLQVTNQSVDPVEVTVLGQIIGGTRNDLLATFAGYQSHQPTSYIGPNGQTTQFTYTSGATSCPSSGPSSCGQLLATTDPLGNVLTYKYSAPSGGYLMSITSSAAPNAQASASLTYDGYGRVYSLTDATGMTRTYRYDAADRITQELFPDGTYNGFGYQSFDFIGQSLDLTTTTDRRGQQTTRHYDADRELTEIDEPFGRTTKLSYWPDGAVHTVSDPRGAVTTYAIDDEGRTVEMTLPDKPADVWQRTFDDVNRVRATFMPSAPSSGVVFPTYQGSIYYAYNQDDTISSVTPATGTAAVQLTYDPDYRRLSGWSDTAGNAEVWAYQPITVPPTLSAGRLVDVENTGALLNVPPLENVISYQYDALGHISERVFGSGWFEAYMYDGLGRVVGARGKLDTFTFGYNDASSRVATRTSLAGPQLALSYYTTAVNYGLLHTMSYSTPGGAPLLGLSYAYDANQNVTSVGQTFPGAIPYSGAPASQTTINGYDFYNNLQTSISSSQGTSFYAPDYSGNNLTTGVTLNNTFNSVNELPAPTQYDANGNLSVGSGVTYSYDGFNRVTSAINGLSETDFSYDGLGRMIRIVEKSGGVVQRDFSYLWCGDKRCLQYDNYNTGSQVPPVTRVYYDQGMMLAASNYEGMPYYYLADQLGSVLEVVGAGSNSPVQDVYEYQPYGGRTIAYSAPGPAAGHAPVLSDIGFAGYFYHSPSGLSLAGSRAYSAGIGRWLNPDPGGTAFAFVQPGGQFNATDLNRYSYARNNPYTFRDPSGLNPDGYVSDGFELLPALAALGAEAIPPIAIATASAFAVSVGTDEIDAVFAGLEANQQADFAADINQFNADLNAALPIVLEMGRGTGERGQTAKPETDKHLRWDDKTKRWYEVDNQTGKKKFKPPGYRPPPCDK